ncbi:MAG: hypothetical protein JWN70_5552 [Planctomycetaceae bacterium]|nr:hypothetical protein [Planctomycetaceae bacterium]
MSNQATTGEISLLDVADENQFVSTHRSSNLGCRYSRLGISPLDRHFQPWLRRHVRSIFHRAVRTMRNDVGDPPTLTWPKVCLVPVRFICRSLPNWYFVCGCRSLPQMELSHGTRHHVSRLFNEDDPTQRVRLQGRLRRLYLCMMCPDLTSSPFLLSAV